MTVHSSFWFWWSLHMFMYVLYSFDNSSLHGRKIIKRICGEWRKKVTYAVPGIPMIGLFFHSYRVISLILAYLFMKICRTVHLQFLVVFYNYKNWFFLLEPCRISQIFHVKHLRWPSKKKDVAPKAEFCEWRINVTIDMQVLYKSSKFQLNLGLTNQTAANNKILRRIKNIK